MTPQPIPYFGRAWQVKIKAQNGKTYTLSSAQSESLRVTFEIDCYMVLQAYWPATLTIYNLAQPITQGIDVEALAADRPIILGDEVLICAGYQNSAAGPFNPEASVIYLGRVLQPVWTRQNVVDVTLKLKCVTNLLQDAFNLASFTLSAGQGAAAGVTDQDVVNQICAGGPFGTPIPIENIDDGAKKKLGANKYPYSVTCHGRPLAELKAIAAQHQLFAWVGPNGLNMRAFDPADPKNKTPAFWYGPPLAGPSTPAPGETVVKRTLIGDPQQMQRGVMFKVLLDSAVQVGSVVGIARDTLVRPFEFEQGKSRPAFPNSSGVYVVVGVRHVGDTRGHGDDWYTEITGVSLSYFPPWLAATDPNIQTQIGTK